MNYDNVAVRNAIKEVMKRTECAMSAPDIAAYMPRVSWRKVFVELERMEVEGAVVRSGQEPIMWVMK